MENCKNKPEEGKNKTGIPFSRQSFLFLITVGIGIIAIVAWLAFQIHQKKAHKVQKERPPTLVSVTKVEQKDSDRYVEAIGRCVADQFVQLIPQVFGKLQAIRFTQGDFVKKGDILFEIDPRPYEAALEKTRAQLVIDRATLAVNETQRNRSSTLLAGKYIAQQDFDVYEARVKGSQGQVQSDLADIKSAEINVDYCYIRAPAAGKMGRYLINVGNVVGSQSILATLQAIDPIYVEFSLADTQFLQVLAYQKKATHPLTVEVTSFDDPTQKRLGQLVFLDNTISKDTATGILRGQLKNADGTLWPGQSVNVRVTLENIPNALLIPEEAVQISQEGPFVYVLKPDQTAEYRKVQPGQRHGKLIIIEDGLKPEDTVITEGQMMIGPGSKVRIIQR